MEKIRGVQDLEKGYYVLVFRCATSLTVVDDSGTEGEKTPGICLQPCSIC